MTHQGTRVMIYCQDSFGLGHLRRNVNIAYELSRLAPNTNILFVADSPVAPFFTLPPNGDFVKLPTLIKVDAGVWKAHRLPLLNIEQVRTIRSQIIKEVATSFEPDVLLVDHMPHGAKGELVESLKMLRRHFPDTQIVLGLRDILGAPEVIVQQWHAEGAYTAIAEYYDLIFVYGCQAVYDLAQAYDFSPELRGKVRYCGYVGPAITANSQATSQWSSLFSTKKPYTVLVMGGGGSDAYFFMDTMLEAIQSLGGEAPFNTFIVTGPFMPAKEHQALLKKATQLSVVVKRKENNSLKYLREVDLVISMAGYNTTCEILKFAKKAVIIPRAGPSAEQSIRSKLLHERQLIFSIHPQDLTPSLLAEAILGRLRQPNTVNLAQLPYLNGATHAAQLLLDCVVEAKQVKNR